MELSKLLEKISEKYPDDKDVMMALDMAGGAEEGMEDAEMELGMEEEMPMEEGAPSASLEDLLSEDMGEEESMDMEDEELPPKKKKPVL